MVPVALSSSRFFEPRLTETHDQRLAGTRPGPSCPNAVRPAHARAELTRQTTADKLDTKSRILERITRVDNKSTSVGNSSRDLEYTAKARPGETRAEISSRRPWTDGNSPVDR
jgi:hypothetical protein